MALKTENQNKPQRLFIAGTGSEGRVQGFKSLFSNDGTVHGVSPEDHLLFPEPAVGEPQDVAWEAKIEVIVDYLNKLKLNNPDLKPVTKVPKEIEKEIEASIADRWIIGVIAGDNVNKVASSIEEVFDPKTPELLKLGRDKKAIYAAHGDTEASHKKRRREWKSFKHQKRKEFEELYSKDFAGLFQVAIEYWATNGIKLNIIVEFLVEFEALSRNTIKSAFQADGSITYSSLVVDLAKEATKGKAKSVKARNVGEGDDAWVDSTPEALNLLVRQGVLPNEILKQLIFQLEAEQAQPVEPSLEMPDQYMIDVKNVLGSDKSSSAISDDGPKIYERVS